MISLNSGFIKYKSADLLILDLAGLNPCFDLVSVPLEFLDLFLEIGLELLLLIRIVRIINLEP